MRILKILAVVAIALSLTACIDFEAHKEKERERYGNRPKHTVTVNFGNETKTYDNVVEINAPTRFRISTILRFNDGTDMEIVGGTVWWTRKNPNY